MMNKKSYLYLFLLFTAFAYGQVPSGEELMGLHQISTSDHLNITNPIEGSLLYNPADKKIYLYNGSNWVETGSNSGNDISFNNSTGKISLSNPVTPGNEIDISNYVRLAPIKDIAGNYTLQSSDTGQVLRVTSSSDITLTFPSGLPTGFHISVYQYGTGTVTFVGSGATIYNRSNRFKTAGQHAGAGIISTAANEFHLVGDLKK